MEYTAKVFPYLCSLRVFIINDIKADQDDFITQRDEGYDIYNNFGGCYNMKAEPKESSQDILNKYNITKDEYYTIAEDISNKLSFGECDYCN